MKQYFRSTQKYTSMRANEGGHTLVEIIVVLAILALLAALSVPRFIDLSANASLTAPQSAISELNRGTYF